MLDAATKQETYLAESVPRPFTDNKVFNSGFLQKEAKVSQRLHSKAIL